MARITCASTPSPYFRATVHPCGTWEVEDLVRCGGARRISHLVIGAPGPVAEVVDALQQQHEGIYLVDVNQQQGHVEAVLHRPVPQA